MGADPTSMAMGDLIGEQSERIRELEAALAEPSPAVLRRWAASPSLRSVEASALLSGNVSVSLMLEMIADELERRDRTEDGDA